MNFRVLMGLAAILVWAGPVLAVTQYEAAKLTASDASAEAAFGRGVAIDGGWAVVGASRGGTSNYEPGAAYFFKCTDESWQQTASVRPVESARADYFGDSVAISGDWAIIGAPRVTAGVYGSGAAYMYHRSGDSWTQVTRLVDPSSTVNESFGTSVSIHGNQAIVSGAWQGAVVYQYDGSAWNMISKLSPSDASPDASFGRSVAISDNYAVVASPVDYRAAGQYYAGAAYVFKKEGETWTQMAKIKASDAFQGNSFGDSVAITDNTIVVGASQNGDYSRAPGSAYVFTLQNGSWRQTSHLKPSNGSTADHFGCSVALDGNDILIGAYDKRIGALDVGAAYWFEQQGSEWIEKAYLQPSGPPQEDGYAPFTGACVDLSDGFAIVGSEYARVNNLSVAGAAYMYEVPEPATLSLMALGAAAILRRRGR